jgi:(R,R)-butanediol dehydrogenase/meso-butanediol dehydrogenase/diacetyl reductase
MLALRWHGRGDVRLDDIEPPPPPEPGQVQIAVAWCGICGTDIEEYWHGPVFVPVDQPHPLTGAMAPLTLGHEFSGTVVAARPGVESPRVGQRVAVDTLVFCGACWWCRRHQVTLCDRLAALGLMADGGLAALCNAPAYSCLPVPDAVSDEAAALAETLAVGVRALRRGAFALGEKVAVFGGGAVGLMTAQAARAGGAARVIVAEPLPARRAVAAALGFEAVGPADAPTGAFDLVVECSGNPRAAAGAVAAARKGGRVVLVGIYGGEPPLPLHALVSGEKSLIGSLSHVYDEDFAAAVALLAAGSVAAEPLISDRVPLSRALNDGLLALAASPDEHLKILIRPGM